MSDASASSATALRAQLDRVAAFEETVRPGLLTKAVRRMSTSPAFAAVYRQIGPRIDPYLARLREGSFIARVYGFPELLLHTVGAKTGQPRQNPLLYVRHGDDFVVLGTNFGQTKHPGWTANLLAHPEASVQVGPELVAVRAELAGEETFAAVLPQFVAIYPGYASYLKRRSDLPPRMFLLHPETPGGVSGGA